jgi:hypothetical protein
MVLAIQIRHPEQMSLDEIDHYLRRARTEPVEQFGDIRRHLLMCRMPRFVRRFIWWAGLNIGGSWRARYGGTFGITGIAALGSASLHLLSPLTTTLTYGVFNDVGAVMIRLFYDHRVLDGIQPALALEELEQVLLGPIADELRGSYRHAA